MKRWSMTLEPADLPRVRITAARRFTGELSPPKLPRKDDLYAPTKGKVGRRLSPLALEFRCCMAVKLGVQLTPLTMRSTGYRVKQAERWLGRRDPLITSGAWALHLTVYVPRRAPRLGRAHPHMDSDACLPVVKDALEWAGVLDDDMRVREDHTRTVYRKGEPGLVITLERLENHDE